MYIHDGHLLKDMRKYLIIDLKFDQALINLDTKVYKISRTFNELLDTILPIFR